MKVIILDDSATVRMILESHLEDLGLRDEEMFSFEDGFEALKFIAENGADIVFSDINMPKMNGYEFAKELFSFYPDLHNSVFAISGDENKESFFKMKDMGVHRFIKKPINAEHFHYFLKPEILKRRAIEELLR
jgi:two-component system response regulator YesN